MRAQLGDRDRRQPAICAYAIDRSSQVACGIGERSVQIEQHDGHRERPRRRARGSPVSHSPVASGKPSDN